MKQETHYITPSKSLAEIKNRGKFSYWNNLITDENFGGTSTAREVTVVNFEASKSSDDVIAWAKEHGYRPATALELLSFAETRTDDRLYVALGSVKSFDGDQHVVSAWSRGAERGAHVGWFSDEWDDDYWFVLVREESKDSEPRTLESLVSSDPLVRIAVALERIADSLEKKKVESKGYKPANVKMTCLSLDCPERVSKCCKAKRVTVSEDEGASYYACSSCYREFIGGKCNAGNKD